MSEPIERVKALMHDPKRTKPDFIADASVDKLIAVTFRLAMEVCVLRDQLDTQRQLLDKHNILSAEEMDGFEPTQEQSKARKKAKEALIANMLSDLM